MADLRAWFAPDPASLPNIIVNLPSLDVYEALIGSKVTGDAALSDKTTDPARLNLLLGALRPPATKVIWPRFAEQADKEGWPAVRFLAALAEHDLAERGRRRIERHLAEARLLSRKTLDTFKFNAVPMIARAQSWPLSPATMAGEGS